MIVPISSYACKCSNYDSLQESVAKTEFISAIKVLSIDTVIARYDPKGYPLIRFVKYTALISEIYKGAAESDTILVYTTTANCGSRFRKGLKYILFARVNPFKDLLGNFPVGKNVFDTSICSFTSIYSEGRANAIRNPKKDIDKRVVPVKLY